MTGDPELIAPFTSEEYNEATGVPGYAHPSHTPLYIVATVYESRNEQLTRLWKGLLQRSARPDDCVFIGALVSKGDEKFKFNKGEAKYKLNLLCDLYVGTACKGWAKPATVEVNEEEYPPQLPPLGEWRFQRNIKSLEEQRVKEITDSVWPYRGQTPPEFQWIAPRDERNTKYVRSHVYVWFASVTHAPRPLRSHGSVTHVRSRSSPSVKYYVSISILPCDRRGPYDDYFRPLGRPRQLYTYLQSGKEGLIDTLNGHGLAEPPDCTRLGEDGTPE